MIKRTLQYSFSLLNIDYVHLSTKWNYQNVISPYYRIYYIDGGQGEISDAHSRVCLEPGYLYMIPSFTLCNLRCDNFLSQYFVQFFEESTTGISLFANSRVLIKIKATDLDILSFNRLLEVNPNRGINRSDNPKVYEKEIFYQEYQELNNRQNMEDYMETQGILMQYVSRFLSKCPSTFHEQQHIPSKIVDSLNYIMAHLSSELSVSLLAERVYQNVDYFSRQFQEYTGIRPINYINQKRIERAQHFLSTTNMSYSEISDFIGFNSLSYFSKTFAKITGMTPSQYKKQSQIVQ
ncbi:helix-turn-helix domain-containing protein [Niabella sp. CJ426]|uniref:helix-turn-helix domain-containing protein n=1 Tax=Niabella sp. CJ426 TaxID=3393740 RepID=UPI003D084AF8